MTLESHRPSLNARRWTWRDQSGTGTPGVALMTGGGRVKAHLTADEARNLADTLHDLADQLEGAA